MTTGLGRGVVAAFDDQVGLGEIDAGGRRYPFHCTQISDGSRRIEIGSAVTFHVRPGRGGRWEAAGVRGGHDSSPTPEEAPG